MKYHQHSDYANSDNPEIPHTRRPKWRVVFRYNAAGYCCGGYFRPMQEGEPFVFPDHTAFPLDRNDIVMPPLWPLDADGRGLSVLEHEGIASLHRTERAIARMVAEHLRAA
jgi:hypothetical protein